MKFFISFFCFAVVCYGDTGFIHLFGYGLLGDTLSTYSTSDYMDCINECLTYDDCLAVQMIWGSGTCNLMTMIRDYTYEEEQCGYYIKNVTTMTVSGRTLDGMDQVIQNVVYASKNVCPDGWTNGSTSCTLSVSESTCDEYASFLEASYDGTECVIPLLTATYSCPNSKLTLNQFSNGYFCYAVILRNNKTLTDGSTVAQVNSYCYQQTGGYLASIHSDEENTYISNMRNQTINNNGLANGAVPIVSVPKTASDYEWYDGTAMDFTNFNFLNETFVCPFIEMSWGASWITSQNSKQEFWNAVKSLACKIEATVTFSKA